MRDYSLWLRHPRVNARGRQRTTFPLRADTTAPIEPNPPANNTRRRPQSKCEQGSPSPPPEGTAAVPGDAWATGFAPSVLGDGAPLRAPPQQRAHLASKHTATSASRAGRRRPAPERSGAPLPRAALSGRAEHSVHGAGIQGMARVGGRREVLHARPSASSRAFLCTRHVGPGARTDLPRVPPQCNPLRARVAAAAARGARRRPSEIGREGDANLPGAAADGAIVWTRPSAGARLYSAVPAGGRGGGWRPTRGRDAI